MNYSIKTKFYLNAIVAIKVYQCRASFVEYFSNKSLSISFHFTCLDLFFIFSHNYNFNQQTTKPVPLSLPLLMTP